VLTAIHCSALLTLQGSTLSSDIEIPAIRFRPESTTIPFFVQAPDVRLSMTLPGWHTQSSFGTPDTCNIGKIGSLEVRGSYLYYTQVAPDHVETLNLTIKVRDDTMPCLDNEV
jgi:hypothetical protein